MVCSQTEHPPAADHIYYQLDTLDRCENEKLDKENVGKDGSCIGKIWLPHFKGISINENIAHPSKQSSPPYIGIVSPDWAKRMDNLDILMTPDPTEFTILNLEISDDSLDNKALEYLGNGSEKAAAYSSLYALCTACRLHYLI